MPNHVLFSEHFRSKKQPDPAPNVPIWSLGFILGVAAAFTILGYLLAIVITPAQMMQFLGLST